MLNCFEDHELPLVQLKEQRRNLVLALAGQNAVSVHSIMEIAALQQTIAAIEAVISDLDAEEVSDRPDATAAAAIYACQISHRHGSPIIFRNV